MQRKPASRTGGITLRHRYDHVGSPCQKTTGGPSPSSARASFTLVALPRLIDHLERLLAGEPPVDLDVLALRLLVDREEVRDLVAQRDREVVELLDVVPVWVLERDAHDLVVDL